MKHILKREGISFSAWVDQQIDEYLARKDPSNPQKPITAFVPGHEDEITSKEQSLVTYFLGQWQENHIEITRKSLMREVSKLGLEGKAAAKTADEVRRRLAILHVPVWS